MNLSGPTDSRFIKILQILKCEHGSNYFIDDNSKSLNNESIYNMLTDENVNSSTLDPEQLDVFNEFYDLKEYDLIKLSQIAADQLKCKNLGRAQYRTTGRLPQTRRRKNRKSKSRKNRKSRRNRRNN
jgi:hypothetical protein